MSNPPPLPHLLPAPTLPPILPNSPLGNFNSLNNLPYRIFQHQSPFLVSTFLTIINNNNSHKKKQSHIPSPSPNNNSNNHRFHFHFHPQKLVHKKNRDRVSSRNPMAPTIRPTFPRLSHHPLPLGTPLPPHQHPPPILFSLPNIHPRP